MSNAQESARASLTIVRRLSAPLTRVYEALTRPEMMLQWWGCEHAPVQSVEADVRPGGRFRVAFRTRDGEDCDCSGTYREVEPGRRLVFTWRWSQEPDDETLVSVELRPVPKGTELMLTHAQFADLNARNEHQSGWSDELHKLGHLVSARAPWPRFS